MVEGYKTPTKEQLEKIKVLSVKSGIKFTGRSFAEAERFIFSESKFSEELNKKVGITDSEFYKFYDNNKLHAVIRKIELDLPVSFTGKSRADAVKFITVYNKFRGSKHYKEMKKLQCAK